MASGPLTGVKILEFAGIGPGPFCGMLLSDLGADIVRIDRKGQGRPKSETRFEVPLRGRRSVALDLKNPAAVETCLKLVESCDAIIEGFRPGVMERLGLGPDVMLKRNPRIVFGRMTGWGQSGPIAMSAGHDINYIAISGALHCIGPKEKPVPPLNLVGDYGGGSLYLAMGMLAAIIHARTTGHGQVVDCAISDGAASLMSVFYGLSAQGHWSTDRVANILDGAEPHYDTYVCADGQWICIAPAEPQFYQKFRELTGFADDPEFDKRDDPAHIPSLKKKIADKFKTKTRDEWSALLEGTDACFAPVLNLKDAPNHPHNKARNTFVTVEGVVQPAPAPRFSRTPGAIQGQAPTIGEHTESALKDWGISAADIASLRACGAA